MTTFSISITLILVFSSLFYLCLWIFPFAFVQRDVKVFLPETFASCSTPADDVRLKMKGKRKKRHPHLRRFAECKYVRKHIEGLRLFLHKENVFVGEGFGGEW
jgi:hypothetical protein